MHHEHNWRTIFHENIHNWLLKSNISVTTKNYVYFEVGRSLSIAVSSSTTAPKPTETSTLIIIVNLNPEKCAYYSQIRLLPTVVLGVTNDF